MSAIFKGEQLNEILDGTCPKGFPASILKVARRKLVIDLLLLDEQRRQRH